MPAFHPRFADLPEEIAVFPLSGALLLLIGVMWERPINMGRRASAWLAAMQ